MKPYKNLQGFVVMLHSAFLFSLMGASVHYLGRYLEWEVIAFWRNLMALVFSLLFLGTYTFDASEYKNVFIWFRCVIGGLGVLTTFYALAHTSISVVTSIMNTSPIWVSLIRHWVYKDRLSPSTWLMIAIGIAGVLFIEAPSFDENYLPILAANCSAITSALVQIFLHELADMDSRKVVFLFSLVATLITVVLLAFAAPHVSLQPFQDSDTAGFILGMGIFGYGGQLAMTRAFALGHPTIISLAMIWNVVFALIMDMIFFGRALTLPMSLGVLFIVTSATVIRAK